MRDSDFALRTILTPLFSLSMVCSITLHIFGLSFVLAVSAFDLFQGMSLLQVALALLVLFTCW